LKLGREVLSNLALVSQLGLSLIMPLLICLAACWQLCERTGVGGWVFIPGFFLGIGGSGMTGYKFYRSVMSREKRKKEKEEKKERVAFNRHL